MMSPRTRHIPLPGTFNIRDLGGYATIGNGMTLWRRILRADSLHKLDAAGVDALLTEGLVAVIDLRHSDELKTAPNPFAAHEDITYVNINLLADLMPSYDAAHNDEVDVLLDLYLRTVEQRGAVICEALEAIAQAPEGTILFHCAAGKDRTGILAALVLSIAGVGRESILDDYELTAAQIEPVLPDYERRAIERGHDLQRMRAMLASRRETMAALLEHLDTRHGGVVDYLIAAGLSDKTIERLRRRILNIEPALG